ncbi:MAG: PEGA domain-containing protein [Deltaproteobacteria bacterium]|nr:PEGA domain-containing protein [Deltaproteobacteria bacterium]
MPRLTFLALAFVLFALGAGTAAAKPKVAVLGVEVTGTIDQASTTVAHDLTEGMRSRVRQGNGPYQLAANSDRELIDEKVLKNCDSEGPLCMSDIGKDIGTDFLIYGKLAKTSDGYKLTINVLDVRRKSKEKSMDVAVPAGSNGDAVRTIARKAYSDLVGGGGSAASGTLVITSNVSSGTVYVDDDQNMSLVDGKATITLPENRYRIAIESPGHKRKEKSVKVAAGEQLSESFDLVALGGGGGGGGKLNVWKPIFGVSLAATLILGGVSLYSFISWRSDVDGIDAKYTDPSRMTEAVGDSDCDGSSIGPGVSDPNGTLADVCERRQLNIITGVAAGGMALVTVGTMYMAFFRNSGKESTSTSALITPHVTPEQAGATVFFRW